MFCRRDLERDLLPQIGLIEIRRAVLALVRNTHRLWHDAQNLPFFQLRFNQHILSQKAENFGVLLYSSPISCHTFFK